jgi:hypothetical protein
MICAPCDYLNIYELPDDVGLIVCGHLFKDYQFLAKLKTTCKAFYKSISVFAIAKQMLSTKWGQFSFRELCINVD